MTLWLPLYHLSLVLRGIFAGAWDDAETEIEAGLALADKVGSRLHTPFLHGMRAWIAIMRGDLVTGEARFQDANREFAALSDEAWIAAEREQGLSAAGPQWPVEYGLWIAGLLSEAQGNLPQALSSLGLAWELSAPLRYFGGSRQIGPDVVRVALAAETGSGRWR